MEYMTPRERMKAALSNKQPDRIPVAPDISNMIPCRLTGKPFWEIYVNGNPSLGKAYLEAVRYFGIDGWYVYGNLKCKRKRPLDVSREITQKTPDYWEVRTTYHTPYGDLTEITVSPKGDSPTNTKKMVKDFKEDFQKLKYLFDELEGYDAEFFEEQKKALGEQGIMCIDIGSPGLHIYANYFDGSLEAATFAYYDYPELFEELREAHHRKCIRMVEMAIDAGADSILTGGSGSITLQSPEIWRELSLPTIRKVTKMCQEAGIISGIHSCGKEEYLIAACATETDLNYVNPLEIPPMGDCSLDECKKKYGSKLALMGNLHTTQVMLYGPPELVRLESVKAILAAGENGGFVLSTGDQCGRDTPDENIFAMVQTVKEFGQYPLDKEKLLDEIQRLEKRFQR